MLKGLLDSPAQLLLVVGVVVLLFGARRLPDAARGLGRSLRIFKSEIKEMKNDDATGTAPSATDALEGRVVSPETPVKKESSAE